MASVISNTNNNSYVTAQLILEENRPFFTGDIIRGKATFISTRPVSPHGIRLIWAGGVTIRPTVMEQENLLYFKKSYAISNDNLAGKKGSNGITYKSAFVEDQDTTTPLLLIMEEALTYTFNFEVKVPTDTPLPSSTSAEQAIVGGKIVYSIECCLDLVENDPSPVKAHSIVTVLELIDVRDPKVATPVTEESVYALWLNGTPRTNPCDFKTAMRAQLPLRACTRGGELTILIHVWHSVEFQRAKGVTVSLVRVRQVHYHGSAYAFPDEVIFSMRADVDIKQEKRFVQALSCKIKIPSDITPSITGSAKLLDVSYKILIKVQLQDGVYQTPSGDVSHFMYAEIPLLIGTVPLLGNGSKVHTPPAIKKSSIRSKNTNVEPSKEVFTDNASIGSADGKKKGRSLRSIFGFGRKKDVDKDKDKDTQDDDKSVNRHSSVSIPKNDIGNRNSFNNGSQGSHSTGSPRIESLPATLESPLTATKTQTSFQVTNSSVELKPDEKDDVTLDFELLDAVKKSLSNGHVLTDSSNTNHHHEQHNSSSSTTTAATAATTATYVSPAGVRTIVQLDRKKSTGTSPSSPTQQKQQSSPIDDHKQEQFPQSPISAPATVTSSEQQRGDNGVIYHDIFESSDEEYDDDDDYNINNENDDDKNNNDQDNNNNSNNNNNNNNNENNVNYHDIFGSDDENDDENDDEYPKENNNNNNKENIKFGEEIVKPSEDQRHLSQHHNTPPSPPLHENDKKSWNQNNNNNNNNNNGENSDSDDDDSSPLNLMLKHRKNTNPPLI